MAQHPFTPEPREPEPWPERLITPWEWEGAELDGHGGTLTTHLVDEEDLERLEEEDAANVAFWHDRGFSIGFGTYVPPSDCEITNLEG
jgi:hypothetical protein